MHACMDGVCTTITSAWWANRRNMNLSIKIRARVFHENPDSRATTQPPGSHEKSNFIKILAARSEDKRHEFRAVTCRIRARPPA